MMGYMPVALVTWQICHLRDLSLVVMTLELVMTLTLVMILVLVMALALAMVLVLRMALVQVRA